MQRYALRDDQWTKIKDFLPGREGHVGGTAPDNRLFVDAVIYRYRTGIPWRDLPERYGVRIPTKPDTESDRSRTVIRAIADSNPTKPDSATYRRVQRVTRQRPCQVCHA